MEFAEKLRQLRSAKGISQTALAQAIFVSRSAVAKWENGLGLPSEDSLKQLCGFFHVTPQELLPDQAAAEKLVKNKRILENQSRVVIGIGCGAGLSVFLMAVLFIPSMREYLMLVALGVMFVVLGAFNLKGNIATIHWYNRRKVTKENQLPYCRLMGWGTLTIGGGLIVSALISSLISVELGAFITLFAVAVGFVLMLIAQFKYNKGLF